MSSHTVILATALTLSFAGGEVPAADLRPYKHPDLDLQFTAPHGWQHRPRPGDPGTHERVDPETGIHVLMWSTSTEQSAKRYLNKMSSMMSLKRVAKPRAQSIDGRDAWVLEARGTVEGDLVETLLAVIPSGRSRLHPFETKLYIVQIQVPAVHHPGEAGRAEQLLETVRVTDRVLVEGCAHRLYPETTGSPPDLPSPFTAPDGEVYVTVRTKDGRYALVPVTVENGAPNDYDRGEWDKGRQLDVDSDDFPTLARTGLHAEEELDRTTTITGRPVAEIDAVAKPGRESTAGFVAEDEAILDVIRGDNRVVARLGLTHPQLAQPLFEVFNLILRDLELSRQGRGPVYNIATVLYDGREIHIEASASKGWQESIFHDEIQGYWEIRVRREPTWAEREYLRSRYGHLDEDSLAALTEMLTTIHTGEMVPFYITRYGFYEGHTDYRADPVAIANLFGLVGLEELDAALGGDLFAVLTQHYRADRGPLLD
jgi:hypothetical protein